MTCFSYKIDTILWQQLLQTCFKKSHKNGSSIRCKFSNIIWHSELKSIFVGQCTCCLKADIFLVICHIVTNWQVTRCGLATNCLKKPKLLVKAKSYIQESRGISRFSYLLREKNTQIGNFVVYEFHGTLGRRQKQLNVKQIKLILMVKLQLILK